MNNRPPYSFLNMIALALSALKEVNCPDFSEDIIEVGIYNRRNACWSYTEYYHHGRLCLISKSQQLLTDWKWQWDHLTTSHVSTLLH